LLILADNLEDAYDEITEKNKEIVQQAQDLRRANEEMQQHKEEIEEQANELEIRKEALEDQADYLHEANERITTMHMEVQEQKDEILQKNEKLVILNNEKNNLIGIVAHDLKSPLNQIAGLISLIKLTTDLEGDSAKYIETIKDSVGRLNVMIAKILDIEAIESKKLNLNLEKVNLAKILNELISNYKITAEAKEIKLINQVDAEEAYSFVDAGFVNQVYENLISNAIKFSQSNKRIFVKLAQQNNGWQCEVKDEGPGISENDQKKLFGKYQKLSAKPTGNETSTGLGLSIVKKYVEAMNGKIWCESQENHGASFFVEFAKQD